MNPMDVRFFVPGKPVPKGNHAAFPIARGKCECKGKGCARKNCFGGTLVGTVITDDKGKELEAWEAYVKIQAISARNAAACRLVEKPSALEVRLVFMFDRPQGHWTTKGQLSAEGLRNPIPSVKPDWDKVSRSTADALTGALCEDDGQIAIAAVAKIYAPERAGVLIRARAIAAPAEWVLTELAAMGIKTPAAVQGGLF